MIIDKPIKQGKQQADEDQQQGYSPVFLILADDHFSGERIEPAKVIKELKVC